MKYVNQKILVFLFVSFTCHKLHSQATNGNTANNIFNSNYFLGWSNTNGANPLFTKTNGINRMRLNGTQTEVISLVPTNTSGFLGLSDSPFFSTNSPWAMLHLEGPNNTPFTGGQWRTWMKTGLFMRENSDGINQLKTHKKACKNSISASFSISYQPFLKLCIPWCSWERNHVADVAHSGNEHHHALKS
jgi:hypothetical protein